MNCEHVYKDLGPGLCRKCGVDVHEINWEYQNKLREQWLKDNPDAKYGGWMSI